MHPTITFTQLQTVAPLPFRCGLPESATLLKVPLFYILCAVWVKCHSYVTSQNNQVPQKQWCWLTRQYSWDRQAHVPHEQPLLTRTSGKLVMHCCVLACRVLDSLLHPKAQIREIFCHDNSTIGHTGFSKGNSLLDNWLGTVVISCTR